MRNGYSIRRWECLYLRYCFITLLLFQSVKKLRYFHVVIIFKHQEKGKLHVILTDCPHLLTTVDSRLGWFLSILQTQNLDVFAAKAGKVYGIKNKKAYRFFSIGQLNNLS